MTLNVASDAFAVNKTDSELIVVLTVHGPYVLRGDHGMTVQDVATIVDHSLGIRCTHLSGMVGERHPMLMTCPDMLSLRLMLKERQMTCRCWTLFESALMMMGLDS